MLNFVRSKHYHYLSLIVRKKSKLLRIFLNLLTTEIFIKYSVRGSRDAKLLFYPRTVTKFVREKSVVLHKIPSSCAVVNPSLPACRNAKQMSIEPTLPTSFRIEVTAAPSLSEKLDTEHRSRFLFGSKNMFKKEIGESENDEKPLSWAEYFGLEDVTVTRTVVHPVTTKYYDTNTVFSFNVKGCRPSVLPFNLALCNNKNISSYPINSFFKEVHYSP